MNFLFNFIYSFIFSTCFATPNNKMLKERCQLKCANAICCDFHGDTLDKIGIKRIYDGVEAETRKSQASFQIIQVSSEALPRMRLK